MHFLWRRGRNFYVLLLIHYACFFKKKIHGKNSKVLHAMPRLMSS